jgi:hypothetical protein
VLGPVLKYTETVLVTAIKAHQYMLWLCLWLWLCAVQLAALQSHRVTMYARMQQLRQQLHMDVHRNHRRLQQLLQEQQALQQQGHAVNMDAQICPVKRQMEVVLGGVDDTVGVDAG